VDLALWAITEKRYGTLGGVWGVRAGASIYFVKAWQGAYGDAKRWGGWLGPGPHGCGVSQVAGISL
jgi:hypothetical protein